MSKRWYFPNKTIDDPMLPFVIEITSGSSVYYRQRDGKEKGVLRRADAFVSPKLMSITIDVPPYSVVALGLNKQGEVMYDIFRSGEVIAKYRTKEEPNV